MFNFEKVELLKHAKQTYFGSNKYFSGSLGLIESLQMFLSYNFNPLQQGRLKPLGIWLGKRYIKVIRKQPILVSYPRLSESFSLIPTFSIPVVVLSVDSGGARGAIFLTYSVRVPGLFFTFSKSRDYIRLSRSTGKFFNIPWVFLRLLRYREYLHVLTFFRLTPGQKRSQVNTVQVERNGTCEVRNRNEWKR